MIVLISPAKTLKRLEIPFIDEIKKDFRQPDFFDKSLKLVQILKTLSAKQLEKLLEVSNSIAKLNYERFQSFPNKLTFDEAYPSIFLFYGDVYKGFDFKRYRKEHIEFMQDHLRILSGLYGILKPLDLIYPYRLEMGTDLSQIKEFFVSSLYDFWKEDITNYLNKELKKQKNAFLINLASNEYFSVIDLNKILFPVIHIHFQEKRNGKYRTIAINAKRARGKMTNWIMFNQIDDIEKLKDFDVDGYKFSSSLSDESNWYFLKG
jgi:cytoplasmic iron level regulating protein YaaA (DUF328/UPF0246 family)